MTMLGIARSVPLEGMCRGRGTLDGVGDWFLRGGA
jgi:hypothetical protein